MCLGYVQVKQSSLLVKGLEGQLYFVLRYQRSPVDTAERSGLEEVQRLRCEARDTEQDREDRVVGLFVLAWKAMENTE